MFLKYKLTGICSSKYFYTVNYYHQFFFLKGISNDLMGKETRPSFSAINLEIFANFKVQYACNFFTHTVKSRNKFHKKKIIIMCNQCNNKLYFIHKLVFQFIIIFKNFIHFFIGEICEIFYEKYSKKGE